MRIITHNDDGSVDGQLTVQVGDQKTVLHARCSVRTLHVHTGPVCKILHRPTREEAERRVITMLEAQRVAVLATVGEIA